MAAALDVEQLYIEEDRAKLRLLKDKRIGRLVVYIRKPADAERLAACKSIDFLEVRGWKEPDLSALQGLAVRSLHLVGGSLTSLKGLNTKRLKCLWVHACGRLRELAVPPFPWLRLWASNNLDLDCLGSVRGLVGLDIGMRKVIDSLAFVAKCRTLRFLTIDAYAWKSQDFRPLGRAPALEIVGFTRLKRSVVEAIGKVNRKLLIGGTSCNCYMRDGRPTSADDYQKLRRAFNKRYGV